MAAEQEVSIVIEGGKLVDGTGNPPVENAAVLIEGNRFKTISRKGQFPYPKTAKVIISDGKTLLPGLWDTHVHYRDWMAELFLAHGVYTIFVLFLRRIQPARSLMWREAGFPHPYHRGGLGNREVPMAIDAPPAIFLDTCEF